MSPDVELALQMYYKYKDEGKWVRVSIDQRQQHHSVKLEVGQYNSNGEREIKHATLMFYVGEHNEGRFLTHVHP